MEHNAEWVRRVEEAARERGADIMGRIELRHIPMDLSTAGFDARRSDCAQYINEVNNGAPWDYVLIDGIGDSRIQCLKKATTTVNAGGFIALDDSWWAKLQEAPSILNGLPVLEFKGFVPSGRSLSRTDIYEIGP